MKENDPLRDAILNFYRSNNEKYKEKFFIELSEDKPIPQPSIKELNFKIKELDARMDKLTSILMRILQKDLDLAKEGK